MLEDKGVSVRLRFKLFESVISSTVLYGLETAPLTQSLQNRLDITQRMMLRRIIGWVCYNEDSWEERGRRMAEKMQHCLTLYPVKIWSATINERKMKAIASLSDLLFWSSMSINWNPFECVAYNLSVARRSRGHPCQRWNDNLA